MSSFSWAKLWIDTLDDHKMGMLPDHLWRRFFEFVLLAKERDESGYLPTVEAMAWRLRTSPDVILADLQALADVRENDNSHGLVTLCDDGWFVDSFEKRQDKPMTAAQRKQNQREREMHAEYLSHYSHEFDTDRDTEKTREEEEEEEEEEIALPAQEADQPLPPKRHNLTVQEIEHPDPETVQKWNDIQPELEMALGRGTYGEYIPRVKPICVRDHCLLCVTDNQYTAGWINDRLKIPILRTLCGVFGAGIDLAIAVLPQPGGT